MTPAFLKEARDYKGRLIKLARTNFQKHLLKHPEIEPYVDALPVALSDPDIVVEADNGQTYFYRLGLGRGNLARCYLFVVVHYTSGEKEEEGRVATFFFTTRVTAEGRVVWRRQG